MACAAGARRVYAVEPTDIIALIPQLAADNGFADRVIIKKCESYDLELPEKADVIIASMLGSAGIGNDMLKVVIDARQRLLKAGGVIIPQDLRPVFCPVELPKWYEAKIDCWGHPRSGFRYDSVRAIAVNRTGDCKVDRKSFLAVPRSLDAISLAKMTSSNVAARLSFQVERPGIFHALAGWVELTMMDGIQCTSSPLDDSRMPWDHLILPLEAPISVQIGDRVEAVLRACSVGRNTVLVWDIWLRDTTGILRAEFHHSSFLGFLLCKEDLERNTRAMAHSPAVS
jgi:protein arginine N-methyltransferase 1